MLMCFHVPKVVLYIPYKFYNLFHRFQSFCCIDWFRMLAILYGLMGSLSLLWIHIKFLKGIFRCISLLLHIILYPYTYSFYMWMWCKYSHFSPMLSFICSLACGLLFYPLLFEIDTICLLFCFKTAYMFQTRSTVGLDEVIRVWCLLVCIPCFN